jgi:tRNA 5-methylaminomethyl-2-thiouridine biosynthesis bifunctional protein
MRLPPRPDLHWKDDGTPVDERVGDVYYSVEDGLEESRAVFLRGCGLPERFAGRESFTVAELGFGTGLNFLALWQMWQAYRGKQGWLHFVSFEGFPLDAADVARALQPWPELADLAGELLANWPYRAKGVHRVVWPEERLSLTLHIGMIEETLPQSEFTADAWFLDGFSPAKNEDMWAEKLWPMVAERTAPGAVAATFTVAGAVRRGLASAGFEVSKQPGHGRKRERLEAIFPGSTPEARMKQRPMVAIVGAGISGACLARALTDRGAGVTVFDRASGPAQGTSGNPLALLMPRIDAGDTVQARFLIEAYNAARSAYRGLPGIEETEVVQRAKDDKELARFEKILADPPFGLEDLEAIKHGLLHKRAVMLRPAELIPALLDGIDVRWGTKGPSDLDDAPYDALIHAGGWQMDDLFPYLRLKGRAGQVTFVEVEVDAPPSAVASGAYALASGQERLWGATYRDQVGDAPSVQAADDIENQAALEMLNPYWRQMALSGETRSRAGVRATTPDRLPVIGALPDLDALAPQIPALRGGAGLEGAVPVLSGRYIAGGFGSRGFTFAPWAARLITAQIFGDPLPTQLETLSLVHPVRQVIRDLKRGLY